MKKLALIAIIALLLSASWADARQGRGKGMNQGRGSAYMMKYPGFHFYDMFQSDLKLDNSQIKKMQEIDDVFQKERIDLQSKVKYAGLDLKKELDQKNINKSEVLKKQELVQNLRNNMMKRGMEYKLDLYSILSSEQKTQLDEVRKNRMKDEKGQGRGKGMGRGNANCDGSGKGGNW
jgi:Spy/CpxP family protein refolding chaperone